MLMSLLASWNREERGNSTCWDMSWLFVKKMVKRFYPFRSLCIVFCYKMSWNLEFLCFRCLKKLRVMVTEHGMVTVVMVSARGMVTAAAMKYLKLRTGPEFPHIAECILVAQHDSAFHTDRGDASIAPCSLFPLGQGTENEEMGFPRSPN